MIKHIVMWKMKDYAWGAGKTDNIRKMKALLEALPAQIKEIKALEVGVNVVASDAAYDVVLYTEFASLDALATYQKHPEHVKVAGFIKEVVIDRKVVDYEV
ncbi:MAG: Dabb family protein [Nitrospirota bacterium]|nr:Dabb family protein [Nitrospirota bacterium]